MSTHHETRTVPRIGVILGFPRSGTTWLANLLNAHPAVTYRHEVIGRRAPDMNENLLSALETGKGLEETERERVLDEILRAVPDVDRPPFFRKRDSVISTPALRWLLWVAARRSALVSRIYQKIYTGAARRSTVLLLKETRSSENLMSMMRSLRPYGIVVIVRSPFGVVASHLKGFESGALRKPDKARRAEWYKFHCNRDAVRSLGLGEADVLSLDETRFVALQWRVYNEDVADKARTLPNTAIVSYENLHDATREVISTVLSAFDLALDEQVAQFIDASKGLRPKPRLQLDAGSRYFSVYRSTGFTPDRWKTSLTDETKLGVEEMLAGTSLDVHPYSN